MIRLFLLSLLCLSVSTLAIAGRRSQPDPFGAHLNSNRGCTACHAPNGPRDRRISSKDTVRTSRATALWGDDATGYFEEVACPVAAQVQSSGYRGMLICLSCHDGNYAPRAMMKNVIYETVPQGRYRAIKSVPTLTDKPSVELGPDLSQHPVGLNVQTGCGGSRDWDCGPQAAKFATHYGFFLGAHSFKTRTVVLCTTCHNPHAMNVVSITKKTQSDLYRAGVYPTRHFLRAPYGVEAQPNTGNESAQFCRQCHADRSNEMNGSSTGSIL